MASRPKAKAIVPVLHTDSPDFEKAFARLVDRRHTDTTDVEKVVRKIIEQVREGGDAELLALSVSWAKVAKSWNKSRVVTQSRTSPIPAPKFDAWPPRRPPGLDQPPLVQSPA